MLSGLTAAGGQVLDPELMVNPLNNYFFTTASSLLIVAIGWFLTDRIIEPRLKRSTPIDGDTADLPTLDALTDVERRALRLALAAMLAGMVLLVVTALPGNSPWRDGNGGLAGSQLTADAVDRRR